MKNKLPLGVSIKVWIPIIDSEMVLKHFETFKKKTIKLTFKK